MTFLIWYLVGAAIAFMLIVKLFEDTYDVDSLEEVNKYEPEACVAFCIGSLGSWVTVIWLSLLMFIRKR